MALAGRRPGDQRRALDRHRRLRSQGRVICRDRDPGLPGLVRFRDRSVARRNQWCRPGDQLPRRVGRSRTAVSPRLRADPPPDPLVAARHARHRRLLRTRQHPGNRVVGTRRTAAPADPVGDCDRRTALSTARHPAGRLALGPLPAAHRWRGGRLHRVDRAASIRPYAGRSRSTPRSSRRSSSRSPSTRSGSGCNASSSGPSTAPGGIRCVRSPRWVRRSARPAG